MNFLDPTAEIADDAHIGNATKVWGLAQVRATAKIGDECMIGRSAYIGCGVVVGDRVKVQNLAQIYEPAVIESGAFIGPGVILTNDIYPRAVAPDGSVLNADDWQAVGVMVREGASIGARAVCVAPVTVGRWAMVGAGATVVDDVPDFALVVGSPAHFVRWIGRTGRALDRVPEGWRCPETSELFLERNGRLVEEVEDV